MRKLDKRQESRGMEEASSCSIRRYKNRNYLPGEILTFQGGLFQNLHGIEAACVFSAVFPHQKYLK